MANQEPRSARENTGENRATSCDSLLPESRETDDSPLDSSTLRDAKRLRAIQETDLLDSAAPLALRLLCELVNAKLQTPVSLVSLVTDELQFFAGSKGLCDPWHTQRSTPLSHSFCQHVVTRDEPLVIWDARSNPLVAKNSAVTDLGIIAYLGVPLRSSDEMLLGSICAIDNQPRKWTERDLAMLEDMAHRAMEEIAEQRRRALRTRKSQIELQQARQMEAIGTLSSAIAHDFNNILMVYQSFSDLIQLNVDDRDQVLRYVKVLQDTTHEAKAVVDQLVGWTQKNKSDEKETINLSRSLRHAVPLIRALIPPSIALEVVIPPDDVFIEATANGVTQILLNLATSAEYAMRLQGGVLTVELRPSCMEDRQYHSGLLLRITDTGCDIPSTDLHIRSIHRSSHTMKRSHRMHSTCHPSRKV